MSERGRGRKAADLLEGATDDDLDDFARRLMELVGAERAEQVATHIVVHAAPDTLEDLGSVLNAASAKIGTIYCEPRINPDDGRKYNEIKNNNYKKAVNRGNNERLNARFHSDQAAGYINKYMIAHSFRSIIDMFNWLCEAEYKKGLNYAQSKSTENKEKARRQEDMRFAVLVMRTLKQNPSLASNTSRLAEALNTAGDPRSPERLRKVLASGLPARLVARHKRPDQP